MGYELHITRKEIWYDDDHTNDISSTEWIQYVNGDEEMTLIELQSEDINGITFTPKNGDALWKRTPLSEIENYFSYCVNEGDIVVKSPDNETIKKMIKIADKLAAKVQGDDGEYYDDTYFIKLKQESKKPWWKFW